MNENETLKHLGLRLLEGGDPEELRAVWEQTRHPSLDWLTDVFELSQFERFCVLLALLPELGVDMAARIAALQGPDAPSYPTEGLALRLWLWGDAPQNREALARAGTLARFFFADDGGGAPGLRRQLRLCDEMLSFLFSGVEGEAPSQCESWDADWEPEPLLPDDRRCREMIAYLQQVRGGGSAFLLYGSGGAGKKLHVRWFSRLSGQPVLFVDAAAFNPEDVGEQIDRVLRAAILGQRVICLDRVEALLRDDVGEAILLRLLEAALEVARAVFLCSREEWRPHRLPAACRLVPMPLPTPDWAARAELWRRMGERYPLAPELPLEEFANKFTFTPGKIRRALEAAADAAAWRGADMIDADCLQKGCYSQISGRMGSRAVRVSAAYVWDDLILPETAKDLLRTACEQVRHRHTVYNRWGFDRKVPYGRGLSMLFSGPPGTGKTMAAQMVGCELGLELYRVNLAGVVSKYIGETEKNLQQIFDEAARSQSILFFDEADALFAKRTEVRDSNDRYANMEAAFLLQKMEEHEGICILATNSLGNFDDAFRRRIKFIIRFPFPDAEYREKLWRAVFPARAPLGGDVDWAFLAQRFELSGGNIKNIAVNAAFLAAAEDGPVDMRAILRAARNELEKNGKSLSREDLGEYYMLL